MLHALGRSIKKVLSATTLQQTFGDWLQTMGEPQPLSSAEKRRRTALAEKDYAAVISAGGTTCKSTRLSHALPENLSGVSQRIASLKRAAGNVATEARTALRVP